MHALRKMVLRTQPVLFQNLNEECLEELLRQSFIKEYEGQQLLVRQGKDTHFLYIPIAGFLRTFRQDSAGHTVTISLLGKGSVCPEESLFAPFRSPVNIETYNPALILHLPLTTVRKQCRMDGQLTLNLLASTCKQLKSTVYRLEGIQSKSSAQRLGHYFLHSYLESGCKKTEFNLPFKKKDIADYLGMKPETFSRALKELHDSGISMDGDKVVMQNPCALCQFCDSDARLICPNASSRRCRQGKPQ